MYLKVIEMMHTFEMFQNMMNHMDEYQALFKMFENNDSSQLSNIFQMSAPFMQGNSGNMPDLSSLQKSTNKSIKRGIIQYKISYCRIFTIFVENLQ